MIKPEVLDAMVAAGCTAEQIAAAVKADQATSSGAVRQARYRERQASRNVTGVTVTAKVSPKKETSPEPPKEKTTPSNSLGSGASEFDLFWATFPNKVGRRDAEKAFAKAVTRASFDVIMAGLRRYIAKTDDRPWCNPTTFLNQDRWTDQPASAPPRKANSPPAEPRNAGERARMKLNGTLDNEPTHASHGRLEISDRGGQVEGTGIARRFAVSPDLLGRIG